MISRDPRNAPCQPLIPEEWLNDELELSSMDQLVLGGHDYESKNLGPRGKIVIGEARMYFPFELLAGAQSGARNSSGRAGLKSAIRFRFTLH